MSAHRLAFCLFARRNFPRQRIFQDCLNPMDMYNDFEMWYRFRFHRQEELELMDELSNATDHPLPRKGSLLPVMQVLVAPQFYTTGSFQIVIADMFGIDRASVSRIIHGVSDCLSNCPTLRSQISVSNTQPTSMVISR